MADRTSNRLLTFAEVQRLAQIKSRTTIYSRLKKNCFPAPCSIGLGRVRWRESDISDWVRDLPQKS
jgi:prophage regulatory protein